MNEELQKEANSVFPINNGMLPTARDMHNKYRQKDFIAGATSKWVEKEKLRFAIEQLYRFRDSTFGKGVDVIKELEQKLSEL